MADYANDYEDQSEDSTEGPEQEVGSMTAQIESTNIAEKLDEEDLTEIGREAKKGFDADFASRIEWEKQAEQWTKLAKLTVENKSFPWPNASNVKYPLLATAAMQFAARAYPSLVPSDGRIVKSRVVGKDPDGQKTLISEAVSIYMSYQIMDEMDCWEEEMDRMLIMLPIVGTMFKKTYWDPMRKMNCSRVILPQNIVVNYWAKNLYCAERISEVLELSEREVKERQQAGLWLDDVDFGRPSMEALPSAKGAPTEEDSTTPFVFIEQHTYIDLDDDGYKEPYIVTFQKTTGKVARIVARFDENTVHFKEDDNSTISYIEPVQYYTKFGFIPNPDGSFYDIGFGILLGPINESVNTLINQLVDSGTLNNLQSGFIGKGLRLRMGEQRFMPGEWKYVNSTGDDLKKQIVPLPSKEPSKVLFELMTALITSGKELASVAEIFTGKMPGQNTPATTTMATVEQGMKVFTAVYKRIYRSLAEEFRKLYRLNAIYLNPRTYVDVLDMEIGPDAFTINDHRILPGADPTAVSQTEKLMKAQGLMEMLQAGLPLDPVKVMQRMLEAQEQPNWKDLIPQQIQQTGQMPPKPPDPKIMAIQMKAQADQAKSQQDIQTSQQKAAMDMQSEQAQLQMKKEEHQVEMQNEQQKMQFEMASAVMRDRMRAAQEQQHNQQSLQQQDQLHTQTMQHNEQQNAAKVAAAKQQAKAKPSPKGAK
jgi:chaperonin GroES